MTRDRWADDDWQRLIYAINQGKCILMLGPDAAAEPVDGRQMPLTEMLAGELAGKLTVETRKAIDTRSLAQVSHCYALEKDRTLLEAAVTEFYQARTGHTSSFHRNLAALPFALTVTTTPDMMLWNALQKEGKKPRISSYNFQVPGDNLQLVGEGSVDMPLLYYLYGRLDPPESLVLTDNDLLDFLVAVVSNNPSLPVDILSQFHDANKTFLFIGFGFQHWYLRILLHVLHRDRDKHKQRRSVAFEKEDSDPSPLLRQNVFFFQRSNYKLHIYQEDLERFSSELKQRFFKRKPPTPPPPPQKPKVKKGKPWSDHNGSNPRVFISHPIEDEDTAMKFYNRLKTAGFKPWLAGIDLKGGEEWAMHIPKAIREADYFVILVSENLVKKRRGYVIREIRLALDLQEEFWPGARFIIPVHIEDCPITPNLNRFQAVTGESIESGIEHLIQIINEDRDTGETNG